MQTSIFAVVTSDGYIAKSTSDDLSWTSDEDKARFTQSLKSYNHRIMGKNTYLQSEKSFITNGLIKRLVLSSQPMTCLIEGASQTSEPLGKILKDLRNSGVNKVAILGGNKVYEEALRFVSDVYLTVEPVRFGPDYPDAVPFTTDCNSLGDILNHLSSYSLKIINEERVGRTRFFHLQKI